MTNKIYCGNLENLARLAEYFTNMGLTFHASAPDEEDPYYDGYIITLTGVC
jgi:hypothetical protein